MIQMGHPVVRNRRTTTDRSIMVDMMNPMLSRIVEIWFIRVDWFVGFDRQMLRCFRAYHYMAHIDTWQASQMNTALQARILLNNMASHMFYRGYYSSTTVTALFWKPMLSHILGALFLPFNRHFLISESSWWPINHHGGCPWALRV